jgi:hypothetical protein
MQILDMDISRGLSSLLFIVPTLLSVNLLGIHYSWTISNGFLIISSVLYNSTQSDFFLFLDYIGIFCVGLSYFSDPRIPGIIVALASYDFYRNRQPTESKLLLNGVVSHDVNVVMSLANQLIFRCKNAVFVGSLVKCNIETFYLNRYLFVVVFLNTVGALVVFRVRHQLYLTPYYPYSGPLTRQHLRLTWMWHLCIMNILTTATIVISSRRSSVI